MRVRAANEGAPEHSGNSDVVDETASAKQEALVFAPTQRLANEPSLNSGHSNPVRLTNHEHNELTLIAHDKGMNASCLSGAGCSLRSPHSAAEDLCGIDTFAAAAIGANYEARIRQRKTCGANDESRHGCHPWRLDFGSAFKFGVIVRRGPSFAGLAATYSSKP
jgi:hypothetical protein